ncbi:MAG TPA: hypothetical protein VFW44_22695 [Bryobacteraceae bacterium]|nr:hypothetical protein [Bryobacteraceae bacterium]
MQPLERKIVDDPEQPDITTPAAARHTWIHKLGILLFIIVCFEVGAFLTIFPWTPQWDNNSFASFLPWLRDLWSNSYFRGALSGLGLLNIYISLGEVSRLRRSASKLHPIDKLKASTL